MNYNDIKNVFLDGGGNIVLQDVNESEITINYGDTDEVKKLLLKLNDEVITKIQMLLLNLNDEVITEIQKLYSNPKILQDITDNIEKYFGFPPEIKHAKDSITSKLIELERIVISIQKGEILKSEDDEKLESEDDEKLESEDDEISNRVLGEGDFKQLLRSIKGNDCILFLGPEISTDKDGNSLHENFYKSISNDDITYNSDDNFFMPDKSEPKLRGIVREYYAEDFSDQNHRGNDILEKLAPIPFKLIVSFCPDNSMSCIFSKYDIDSKSFDYTGNKMDIDLSQYQNKRIIFNALGRVAIDRNYIFTHKQFNDFLKKEDSKRIPVAIDAKIKEATNYIFVGFSFDKWQYRLLMFSFNFLNGSERYAPEHKSRIKRPNRGFLKRQFGIDFIDAEYDAFASKLLEKCLAAGICKPLKTSYVENTLKKLKTIWIKNFDSTKLEELNTLKQEVDNIENLILQNIG